jgi:hypothetical protein
MYSCMFVGSVLAVLADRLHYFEIVNGSHLEDNRIINGGLTLCRLAKKLWILSRKYATETYLTLNAKAEHAYLILGEDRLDSCVTAKYDTYLKAKPIENKDNDKIRNTMQISHTQPNLNSTMRETIDTTNGDKNEYSKESKLNSILISLDDDVSACCTGICYCVYI